MSALGALHTTINDTWAVASGKQWEGSDWYWTALQYTSLLCLLAFSFLRPSVLPVSHLDDPFNEKPASPKQKPKEVRASPEKSKRQPTLLVTLQPAPQPEEKILAALVKERRKRRFYGADSVHVNLSLHGTWLTVQPTTPGKNRVMHVKNIRPRDLFSCTSTIEWGFDYEGESYLFEMNDRDEVERWVSALSDAKRLKTPKAGFRNSVKQQPSPPSARDMAALAAQGQAILAAPDQRISGSPSMAGASFSADLCRLPESGPPLTPAQEEKRTKLDAMLFGDGITKRATPPKGSEYKQETLEGMAGTGTMRLAYLKRFLKARQWDVKKAHHMVCASVHWKGTFIGGIEPRPPPIDRHTVDEVRRCIPHDWLGFSKHGRLVYLERSGGMDVPGLNALLRNADGAPDPAKLLHYHVMVMEYQLKVLFPRESMRRGEIVDKVIVINDLEGLGAQHVSTTVLGFLKTMSRSDQDNYCDHLHKLYVVNAPWIFSVAWRVIKTFLEKHVQEKIHILSGSEAHKVLVEEIGAANVPEFLGGTYECEGPCTSTVDGHATVGQREMDRYYSVPGWEKYIGPANGMGAGARRVGAKETMATAGGMLVVDTSKSSPSPVKRTLLMDSSTPCSNALVMASRAFAKKQFNEAAAFVKTWTPKQGQPGASEKLQCYSLYKQAVMGDVKGPRPGMLDFANQAKWDAWSECKGCHPEDAMRSYVHVIEAQVRRYDPDNIDFAKIVASEDPLDQGYRGRSMTQEMELI
jgi:acyl-CoA-binding protein